MACFDQGSNPGGRNALFLSFPLYGRTSFIAKITSQNSCPCSKNDPSLISMSLSTINMDEHESDDGQDTLFGKIKGPRVKNEKRRSKSRRIKSSSELRRSKHNSRTCSRYITLRQKRGEQE